MVERISLFQNGYAHTTKNLKHDEEGNSFLTVEAIRWITNIGEKQYPEPLQLTENYSPERYPTFDHLPVINVDAVKDIPADYSGLMGVPLSFLEKWNPEQFDLIDHINFYTVLDALGLNDSLKERKLIAQTVNRSA